MTYDIHMIQSFYATYAEKTESVRRQLARPLTYAEKILFAHAAGGADLHTLKRNTDYSFFYPDRVCMQDATAQMAILQFINSGRASTAVPTTVHCDHLIQAYRGAEPDLKQANTVNSEVYDFLRSAARRYGMGFWAPGVGIIHQIVLENYAFPGGMMIGTDSHTPNAGGLGMAAIGVGGADAVDVMTGNAWELKIPRLIGVRLSGRLSGWTSAKDVILCLAGKLTTKGGTNAIIEYFGEGTQSLSATDKATICNMGAEVGATTSIFPFDESMAAYLRATGRADVAEMASALAGELCADHEVAEHPGDFFDELIEIDLSTLSPHLNGPFTPDAACLVSNMAEKVRENDIPERVEVCLIGSCTNSSYRDLARAASVIEAGLNAGFQLKAQLIVCPGSEMVKATAERDGLLQTFRRAGAVIMTNACGPCIGQWHRITDDPLRRNSIVTTFNRNFAKRADGNPNTFAFIASPEVAAGYAFTGSLAQHPSFLVAWKDVLPTGPALPPHGYDTVTTHTVMPEPNVQPDAASEIIISPTSERLQRLQPFHPWDGRDFEKLPLLIKVKGKCTTDHISMAGKWLRFRGHLHNISRNLLLGAVNAFSGKTGQTTDSLTGAEGEVWQVAEHYREVCGGSVIVAEDNYGEGSSREHAAMEPRYLGVKAVLAKSFARIHETNLKKQGILALTFAHPADYDSIDEGCRLTIRCADIAPGRTLMVEIQHTDGSRSSIEALHTYNDTQIAWFRAGSALRA